MNSIFSIYNNVEAPSELVELPDQKYDTNSWGENYFLNSTKDDKSRYNTNVPWDKFQFSNYQITGEESSKERMIKYRGVTRKLTDILDTLHKNEPNAVKHYCTRAISNALETISDVNSPCRISDPQGLYNALKSSGWEDVLDDNYVPQAGDVWTYKENNKRMHSSMYDGEKWISYDVEGKDPWLFNQNKKTKVGHIQRYREIGPSTHFNQTQTTAYNKTISIIKEMEGGFANDPNDSGGATNKGVTLATFRREFGLNKTIEDLKNITDELWNTIFSKYAWLPSGANRVNNPSIASLISDWVWGSGLIVKRIQKALGVELTGTIDSKTLAALNTSDTRSTFQKLWNARKLHFYDIVEANPKKKRYLNGWLNRLNKFAYYE